MPAEIPYYMPYLRPAEYQEYLRKKAIEEIEAKYPYVPPPETYAEALERAKEAVAKWEAAYPYVPPPETYAEALERAKAAVAEREAAVAAAVAKPFPWKWVIIGGILLLVGYSIVKK